MTGHFMCVTLIHYLLTIYLLTISVTMAHISSQYTVLFTPAVTDAELPVPKEVYQKGDIFN